MILGSNGGFIFFMQTLKVDKINLGNCDCER